MKPLFLILFTMALIQLPGSSVAIAAEGELRFDGEIYRLAWKLVTSHQVKNEYVRSGETVEHWQRLITVQQFPQNEDPAAFAKTLLNLVEQRMPGEASEILQKQSQFMLCYFLDDATLGKTEFVFQRVCKEPGSAGLKVYTFSIHASAPVTSEEIQEIKSKKLGWLTELSRLHTGMVK
jgi:hypothetical protein